ncbi:MAG: hypothetical protein ACN4E2_01890 [Nitrospinota bacterium]
MSDQKGSYQPADFSKLTNFPIKDRQSLVSRSDFVDLGKFDKSKKLVDLFPNILKGGDLLEIVKIIQQARSDNRLIFFGMGAHVVKVGLAPIIIKMMEDRYINAIAVNGAFAIHDLEIAFHGQTSEDVASEVKSGRFGMVDETGILYNEAIAKYKKLGAGEAIGRHIELLKMPYRSDSILAASYRNKIPATVHIGIGSDITHIHKSVSGEDLGRASLLDFKIAVRLLKDIKDGGVFINIGSAVVLPEVFIKALSAARNLYGPIENFTTLNFDMIQSYRQAVNIVNRPVEGDGRGYAITGHHELMIPLLYFLLTEENKV